MGAYAEAPFPTLRSVLALHSELVTIVARPGIRELADLAGKRIVAGPAGSGSRATWEGMGKALGWKDGQTPRTLDMPARDPSTQACWCWGTRLARSTTSSPVAPSISFRST